MKQHRSKTILLQIGLGAAFVVLALLMVGSAFAGEQVVSLRIEAPAAPQARFFVLPYPSFDPTVDAVPLAGIRTRGQESKTDRLDRPTHYRLSVPAGPFVVAAVAPGFVDLRGPFQSGVLMPTSPLLFEHEVDQYQGTLVDADGIAVAGAQVTMHAVANVMFTGESRDDLRVVTADDGSFSVPYLTGLPWMLQIVADGYPAMTRMGDERSDEVVLPVLSLFTGRVTDSEGQPVSGTRAVLFGRDRNFAWKSLAAGDDQGEFRLAVWPSPQQQPILTVEAAGYARSSLPWRVDETAFELQPANGLSGSLETGTEAFVRLKRKAEIADPFPWEEVAEREAKGAFAFDSLPDGSYLLEVRTASAGLQMQGPFDLTGGKIQHLGPVSSGKGVPVAGFVIDEQGKPVADAQVSLLADNYYTIPLRFFPAVRTSADGSFAFADIAPGQYTAEVIHPDFAWTFERVDAGIEGDVELKLRAHRGGTGRIEGTLSQRMWGEDEMIALAFPRSSRRTLWAVPDAEGHFSFDGLLPDDYTLDRMALPPDHRAVSVREGETGFVSFGPAKGMRTRGRIFLGDVPLSDVAVTLEPLVPGAYVIRNPQPPMSDDSGFFEVGVPDFGTYTPRLAVQGMVLSVPSIDILPGEDIEIHLPATRLTGRVVDPTTGRALAGVRFSGNVIGAAQIGGSFKGITDQEGRFTVVGVVPGTCELRFTSAEFKNQTEMTVELLAGQVKDMQVELSPGN